MPAHLPTPGLLLLSPPTIQKFGGYADASLHQKSSQEFSEALRAALVSVTESNPETATKESQVRADKPTKNGATTHNSLNRSFRSVHLPHFFRSEGAQFRDFLSNAAHTNQFERMPSEIALLPHGDSINSLSTHVMDDAQELHGPRAQLDLLHFSEQVLKGLSALINQRGGILSMRLNPPELGRLHVHVRLVSNVVNVEFTAENAQARSLLDEHLMTLKTAIERHGIVVDRMIAKGAASLPSHAEGRDAHVNSDTQDHAGNEHGTNDEEGQEQYLLDTHAYQHAEDDQS